MEPDKIHHEDLTGFLSRKGYEIITVQQNAAGLLLVSVKVNSIEGLFILDTGAGASVLDASQVERFQVILHNDRASFDGAGAGGKDLQVIPSSGNVIEIGNHRISDFTFTVMSLEHVSQALSQAGIHEEFLGVIGADILKPAKAIIDYNSLTLYLWSESL